MFSWKISQKYFARILQYKTANFLQEKSALILQSFCLNFDQNSFKTLKKFLHESYKHKMIDSCKKYVRNMQELGKKTPPASF